MENNSAAPAAVRVYLEDFVYLPPFDGNKEFFPPGSTKFSLASWLTYYPQEFIAPPYSSQEVNFTISSDDKLTGMRCGVLFFEAAMGATYEKGEALNVVGRLGSLIFVESHGRQKAGDFKNVQGAGAKLTGAFVNSGNCFLRIKGTFYVMDDEGMVEDRGQTQDLYLLPDDKAVLDINLPKTLSSGNYIMVVTFDMEDGDVLVKEIDFSFSPSGELKVLAVRD